MKIRDLPRPVTASKADWLPAYQWMGFTPTGTGSDSRQKCQAAVIRQMANGFVLERVTSSFGEPNAGFERDPRIVRERAEHASVADSLTAIHQLRHSALPLRQIVGDKDFEWLQDAWGDRKRSRWSVAFPIVKSFRIIGAPKAKMVLSPEVFSRVYQSQNALLRAIDDQGREEISNLEVEEIEVPAVGIALEQDFEMADKSHLASILLRRIEQDLAFALEGETEERRRKLIKRAAWLADKFIRSRIGAGTLQCDDCNFDPSTRPDLAWLKARSCFDVHHRNPLAEGKRLTGLEDFALLCPTCHRIEHLKLRAAILGQT